MTLTKLQNDLLVTLALALVAAGLAVSTGWIALDGSLSAHDTAAELAVLSTRDIIARDASEGPDGLVGYAYVGGKLPELLAPDEAVERRTESSWTRIVDRGAGGTSQVVATTVIYPQQAFVQRGDGWHYVEYGRTTSKAMERYEAAHEPLSLLVEIAHADTFSAATGDGDAVYTVTATSTTASAFNTAQSGTTGTSVNTGGFTGTIGPQDVSLKGETLSINRAFLPFNTSAIPAGATITAASLTVYGTSTGVVLGSPINDGTDYITVVQTTQTDYTALATSDYSKNGSPVTNPTEGIASGNRKDVSSGGFATSTGGIGGQSAPNTFTLNATGIGWVKKAGQASACSASTGITCLGLREGHDTTRTTISTNTYSVAGWVQTDNAGTEADPFLTVTYSIPFAFWQFQDY